jgi:hypothetical protein
MWLQADGLHKGRSVMPAKEEDIYRALSLPSIEPAPLDSCDSMPRSCLSAQGSL